jgi:acylphosphatase
MVLSGRVQGVGFRYFTRRVAERLELVGWVKNLPSGEVEVRVSGPQRELDSFREQLRQGPPGSRVDRLSEVELAADHDWAGFKIAY